MRCSSWRRRRPGTSCSSGASCLDRLGQLRHRGPDRRLRRDRVAEQQRRLAAWPDACSLEARRARSARASRLLAARAPRRIPAAARRGRAGRRRSRAPRPAGSMSARARSAARRAGGGSGGASGGGAGRARHARGSRRTRAARAAAARSRCRAPRRQAAGRAVTAGSASRAAAPARASCSPSRGTRRAPRRALQCADRRTVVAELGVVVVLGDDRVAPLGPLEQRARRRRGESTTPVGNWCAGVIRTASRPTRPRARRRRCPRRRPESGRAEGRCGRQSRG